MAPKRKKATTGRRALVVTGKFPLRDPEQELFCVLYTSNSTPRFFGHGQNCYAEAYGHQRRLDEIAVLLIAPRADDQLPPSHFEAEKKRIESTCRSVASRLLATPDIKKRCAHLLDSFLKYEIVDREHVKVILQDHEPNAKIRAIELYKKERGHFVDAEKKATAAPQKVEVTYKWKDPLPRAKPPEEKK